jgi:hypothetical protein
MVEYSHDGHAGYICMPVSTLVLTCDYCCACVLDESVTSRGKDEESIVWSDASQIARSTFP